MSCNGVNSIYKTVIGGMLLYFVSSLELNWTYFFPCEHPFANFSRIISPKDFQPFFIQSIFRTFSTHINHRQYIRISSQGITSE